MAASELAEKTLDVLEAVAALGSGSLPAIRARVDLPTTTTYRILETLARRGFVMRCGRRGYQLGTAALALAGGASERALLRAAARLPLQSLARKSRSHAHLGTFDDGMVTYLVKQSHGLLRIPSVEGSQLEAYCSALGKVLLSALAEDAMDRYLDGGALVALTPNTITDHPALIRELADIRARGWAMDDEEIAEGLRCVAVPVRARCGRIIAAISISTVAAKGVRTNPMIFLPDLMESAEGIGRQLYPPT